MARLGLALLALGLGAGIVQPAIAEGARARVTYVANEGFLIEAAGKKVLVDALFSDPSLDFCHVPDAATLRQLEAAEAPFDAIDLILVTHEHVDHFDARVVLRHLSADAATVAVGPPQMVSALRAHSDWSDELAERVREIDLQVLHSTRLTIHGVGLDVLRLRHSQYLEVLAESGIERDRHAGVENLAYLVNFGGFQIAHVGDALLRDNRDTFERWTLSKRETDVLFMGPWHWPDELVLAEEWLAPKQVVFMHLHPSPEMLEMFSRQVKEWGSEAVVFREPRQSVEFQ